MSCGRELWKAPRQLIDRGMPLKEMHFRPISRWSSAIVTGFKEESCFWAVDQRRVMALGAFIVIAVAVLNVSQAVGLTSLELALDASLFIRGWRVDALG